MKSNILFPNKLKIPALIVFIPSIVMMLGKLFFDMDLSGLEYETEWPVITDKPLIGSRRYFVWVRQEMQDIILLALTIASGVLFAFSKERVEDEMVASIRKDSLIWAVYSNYAVLLFCIFAFAGLDLFVILSLNILSLLVFSFYVFSGKRNN